MFSAVSYLNDIYPLSKELKEHLAQLLKEKHLRKREYLLTIGQVSRYVSFIQQGLLRTFYIRNTTEINTWFLKEGDVAISMRSFFGQVPSNQAIQAIEDTTISTLTYTELQELYSSYPELNIAGRIIMERNYQIWSERSNAIKMHNASERYRWLLEHHPELVLRVPAKYIASYLGVTEVTLSKIRSKRL